MPSRRPSSSSRTATPRAGRARDAATTRAAILGAARRAFAGGAYDQVGVRDIAADVGVDPAMVIRYFGSKERLFEEAVAGDSGMAALFAADRAQLGELLARAMLDKSDQSPLLALLYSAPHPQASAILRRALDEQFIRPLARVMGGVDAELRASLLASYLLGLAVLRSVLRSEPLASHDLDALVRRVAPTIQQYVDGALPAPPPASQGRRSRRA